MTDKQIEVILIKLREDINNDNISISEYTDKLVDTRDQLVSEVLNKSSKSQEKFKLFTCFIADLLLFLKKDLTEERYKSLVSIVESSIKNYKNEK